MISMDRRPLACLPPVRRSFMPVDLEPRVRGGGIISDFEGHMPRIGRSLLSAEQPRALMPRVRTGVGPDVEGHMPRIGRGLVAASPRLPNRVTTTLDVLGHMPRVKGGLVEDVEGHMPKMRNGFFESPA